MQAYLVSLDHAYLVSLDHAYLVSLDHAHLVSPNHAYLVSLDHAYLVILDHAYLVSLDHAYLPVGDRGRVGSSPNTTAFLTNSCGQIFRWWQTTFLVEAGALNVNGEKKGMT